MAVVAHDELFVYNPATLQVVGSVRSTDPAALQEAVDAAKLAQARFGEATLGERRDLLLRVAELVLERADDIADVVVSETAKPRLEVFTTELFPALDALVFLARNMPK